LWAVVSLILMIALWQGRTAAGLAAFTVAFGALLIWWQRIEPSNDRIWADDVAQMTTGTVDGNRVTLRNVRNFDWRSNNDYTQRWETRHYDLDRLHSVDMIMSYWTGPAIAHMLISFGFDDGEHVVFSVEIRRERIESFSEIGGFFKEFELSVIAADERDVIRVRNQCSRRGHLPIPPPHAGIRDALAAPRLHRGGQYSRADAALLQHHYGQLHHARLPDDAAHSRLPAVELPFDFLRLSSRVCLPRRRLDQSYSLKELRARGRISERAQEADRSDTFSEDIRRGIPE